MVYLDYTHTSRGLNMGILCYWKKDKEFLFYYSTFTTDLGDFQKNEEFVWHRGWNFKLDKL